MQLLRLMISVTHLVVLLMLFPVCFYPDDSVNNGVKSEPSEEIRGLEFSLVPLFESHFLFNLTALDSQIGSYGFTPIDSPVLIAWGVKGCFYEKSGFIFGGKVTYGNQSFSSSEYDVPTYSALTKMGYFIGKQLTSFMNITCEIGFGAMSHSVSSYNGGGALVYLGPYIQPTVSFYLHKFRWLGEISVAYYAHFPIGSAHHNPLWEEEFSRPIVHGISVSVGTGFANEK